MSHDLDLSESRDVLGHVTIRISIHFLLMVVCSLSLASLSPAISEILSPGPFPICFCRFLIKRTV